MRQQRPGHILNAASNLLGISLVIIAGLNVSHAARTSFADEIAWGAAVCLGASCFFSYVALRDDPVDRRGLAEIWADRIFLIGLAALILSIVVLAFQTH